MDSDTDDWPLWGDPGDLFAADPTGHIDRICRAVLSETLALALGLPLVGDAVQEIFANLEAL